MNLESLQRKLLAAAKANQPSDRIPYAFAKRVLAHLKQQPLPDPAALWARALWRAVIPCVAVALILTAVAFLPNQSTAASDIDLSQAFEQTLLAPSSQSEAIW